MKRSTTLPILVFGFMSAAALLVACGDDEGPAGTGTAGMAGKAGGSATGGKAGTGGSGGSPTTTGGGKGGTAGAGGSGTGGGGTAGASGSAGAGGSAGTAGSGGSAGSAGRDGGGGSGGSGGASTDASTDAKDGGTGGSAGGDGAGGSAGAGGSSGAAGAAGSSGAAGAGGSAEGGATDGGSGEAAPDASVVDVQVDVGDAGAAVVVINEIESNGGTPDDWVELTNLGTATADLSNWVLKDSGEGNNFTIPAGTTLAPGAFVAIDVGGLGASDSARLFNASATLVDSNSWTAHAATTLGRCPDGTGAFVVTVASTKGAANSCPVPGDGGDAAPE